METRHDTRDLILDAAERLFALAGIEPTSVREITHEAGVNLAAVNYHFGNKEGLVRAVVARRIEPINRERYALLDHALGRRGGVKLRDVIHAFVHPAIVMLMAEPDEGTHFVRFMGRMHMEASPANQTLMLEHFEELVNRFADAMQLALPDLDRAEIFWRFHFAVGAFSQAVSCGHLLEAFTDDACHMDDPETVTERLVTFLVGGFKAKTSRKKGGRT